MMHWTGPAPYRDSPLPEMVKLVQLGPHSSGSSGRVGGARNMKSMRLLSTAIFFMTYFYSRPPSLDPPLPHFAGHPPRTCSNLFIKKYGRLATYWNAFLLLFSFPRFDGHLFNDLFLQRPPSLDPPLPHFAGHPSLDMFKLVHWEVRTVGNLLECFLVTFFIP